jgi:hypothetical protein
MELGLISICVPGWVTGLGYFSEMRWACDVGRSTLNTLGQKPQPAQCEFVYEPDSSEFIEELIEFSNSVLAADDIGKINIDPTVEQMIQEARKARSRDSSGSEA